MSVKITFTHCYLGHWMDAKTAIDGMVRASGKTPAEIAEATGRSRTYVYTLSNQGSVPRLDTFVRLAHACGYRLVLETKDGSRGVELYTEVDERQEDSGAVCDEANAILEKTMGKAAVEKLNTNEWYELTSQLAPRALDAIRRREGLLFEDGNHQKDAYDTLMTDIFSPWR